MKKLFGILTALIPAIYAGGMALFLLLMPEDEVLFAVLGGTVLLSLVFCVGYGITSSKAQPQFLARMNLWIISGNLALYIAEITWLIVSAIQVHIATQQGGMEGGLGTFLLIIFYIPSWISYLVCRCTAAMCCNEALKGATGNASRTIHTILHLFPVLDLCSAIWVYRKVKHCHTFQQPTIETQ